MMWVIWRVSYDLPGYSRHSMDVLALENGDDAVAYIRESVISQANSRRSEQFHLKPSDFILQELTRVNTGHHFTRAIGDYLYEARTGPID